MGGRAGAWRGPTGGHGAPGALGTRGAEDGFFPPPCEDTLPFLQPCEGSREQPSIYVSNPLVVAFQLMHECCRASVPPGSGEMLPLPSCLPSLTHTLGQVQAWPSLIAGPSFTLPLSWGCSSAFSLELWLVPVHSSAQLRALRLPLATWSGSRAEFCSLRPLFALLTVTHCCLSYL